MINHWSLLLIILSDYGETCTMKLISISGSRIWNTLQNRREKSKHLLEKTTTPRKRPPKFTSQGSNHGGFMVLRRKAEIPSDKSADSKGPIGLYSRRLRASQLRGERRHGGRGGIAAGFAPRPLQYFEPGPLGAPCRRRNPAMPFILGCHPTMMN